MKASSRIILNTLATYGRSVVAMALSLFSARWILQGLGAVDFGLYGVVGSIVLLIQFLNGGMSVGVARFYAYSIGRGQSRSREEAADDLMRWFNTALSIHLLLPILVVAIGIPLGSYAIRNWLAIPAERIPATLWVLRTTLITAFVNTLSIPFIAMYTAYQYIAELAVFGLIGTLLAFAGSYLLLHVGSDRLIFYSVYVMLITSGIPLIQMLRAVYRFPACRPRIAYLFDRTYLRNLFQFVGWKFYGMTCVVLRTQGSPVLVNLFFGPQVNAAFNIAQRVSTQATTLSAAMANAFQPAITAMEGGGDRSKVIDASLQVCKFGSLLVLLFAIPLILEMDAVLTLWLGSPPPFTRPLCIWMLIMLVIDNLTFGHMIAIGARGKIAAYELVQGTTLFLAVPLLWLFFALGMNPNAVGYSLLATMAVYSANRLLFGKWLIGMPVTRWIRSVGTPVSISILCSCAAGWGWMQLMPPGPLRILTTSLVTCAVTAVLGWYSVLSANERAFVRRLLTGAAARLGLRRVETRGLA